MGVSALIVRGLFLIQTEKWLYWCADNEGASWCADTEGAFNTTDRCGLLFLIQTRNGLLLVR